MRRFDYLDARPRRADVLLVDLRDPRELSRDGKIPGAFHCPSGMLEFWIDPESPDHKPQFASGQQIVFYCASGWRSALSGKTAVEMGLVRVHHLKGGFTAWKEAGGEVETVPTRD
ncbi:MAG: rhodanese-like domain-containing protein [Mesorhizobium sp.]